MCLPVSLYLLSPLAPSGNHLENDTIISQQKFVEIVQSLHDTDSPYMNPSLFIFQLSTSAAGYNAKVLADMILTSTGSLQINISAKYRMGPTFGIFYKIIHSGLIWKIFC